MKVLICDDNQSDIESLKVCLNEFIKNKDLTLDITVVNNGKDLLVLASQFELIFLDIELQDENGIELGMQLRKQCPDIRIVITSSYAKYLVDGYKIQADRYFIKPIEYQNFKIEMEAVLERYLKYYAGFDDLKIAPRKIYYHEILYVEFLGRKTLLHLKDQTLSTNYPLKYWIALLKDYAFGQSHKAFLVNFEYVGGFTNLDVKLTNQELVPLSRRFKQQFISQYSQYLHQVI